MTSTNAVWYELLPYDALTPAVLKMLAERDLGIYLAVTPNVVSELPDTVRRCKDHGLHVGVWPMVEQEHGRWPSVHNIDRFESFVAEVRERLDAEPDALILDFEPPIDAVPALMRLDIKTMASYLVRGIPQQAVNRYAALADSLNQDGIHTVAAALPLILGDDDAGGFQRFFGTPLDTTPCGHVSAMLYTSIMEGFARGRLSRRDIVSVLGVGARAVRRRYGSRASVSLGAVDVGALGDEPTYRTVEELRRDVAVTRAAGIDHIVLFSVCGAMRRPPIEPWLDALVNTEPGPLPEITPRARAFVAAVWSASRVMRLTAGPLRRLRARSYT